MHGGLTTQSVMIVAMHQRQVFCASVFRFGSSEDLSARVAGIIAPSHTPIAVKCENHRGEHTFGNAGNCRNYWGNERLRLLKLTMQPEIEARQQHRRLQKEYGIFYRAVSDILFRQDPMDLDGKRNIGGYDPQIDALLSRIREAEHLNALHDLLFEVFRTDFGEENCGHREHYETAASEIWKAYERQRFYRGRSLSADEPALGTR